MASMRVVLGLATLILLPIAAFADLPPVYHVDQVTLSNTTSYFTTDQNYDRYGNKLSLFPYYCSYSDCKLTTVTNSIDGKYDMDSSLGVWSFGAGVDIDYAQSRGPDIVFDDEKSRSNSQFDDIHFVLQKPIPLQQFRIIPELKGSVAFNPIAMSQIPQDGTSYYDNALTSDAADTVQAGSWIVGNFPHTRLYAYVGYEYRDNQYAALLPWMAGGLFQYHRFIAGAEIDGYSNVTQDQYGYGRETLTDRVDGGSLKYFAANPIESDMRLNLGYSITPDLSITGAWSNTLSGQEIAIGQTFYATIAYSFDVTGNNGGHYNDDLLPRNGQKRVGGQRPGNGQFQPNYEKYDESLFESN